MNPASRILALRGGAIGDFILTLPALRALREAWPDSRLELAGYPHIAELALAGGLADRVESLHKARIARLYGMKGPLDTELAGYLAGFDAIISFLHDPDGSVVRNLEASGVRTLFSTSPIHPTIHAADHLLWPVLEWLEKPRREAVPQLRLSDDVAQSGRQWAAGRRFREPVLALHPGSGSPGKNWPIRRYLDLASRRLRFGKVAFVLGEADAAIAAEVRAFCAERECPLLDHLPLTELASRLAAVGSFAGNDSGITHLAAALELPTLALFGPTDPEIWAPRGSRVRVLRSPDGRMDGLPLETVAQEVDALISSDGTHGRAEERRS